MPATLATTISFTLIAAAVQGGETEVVDFEGCVGQTCDGWSGPAGPGGQTSIDPRGGNPGGNLHTVFNNFQALPGQLTGDQLDRQMVRGQLT